MNNKNKFLTIYDDLKEKITQQIYQHSDFLPSENELSQHYQASRETIRKALTLLQNNGFILKVRGKGSKVIFNPAIHFDVGNLISFHELNHELASPYQTKVLNFQFLDAGQVPKVHEQLQMARFQKVLCITRARLIDNIVHIIDTDYFNPDIIRDLTEDIAQGSIYQYIEDHLGLDISHSLKTITFDKAEEDILAYFKSLDPPYTATVTSTVFLADSRPFQYNISRHRPSSFQFMDFSRRIK